MKSIITARLEKLRKTTKNLSEEGRYPTEIRARPFLNISQKFRLTSTVTGREILQVEQKLRQLSFSASWEDQSPLARHVQMCFTQNYFDFERVTLHFAVWRNLRR
jgi:hypothetical protein